MNIEEAKDTLANCIADYVIGDYCTGNYCAMEDECVENDMMECVFQQAIDTVLSELEKKDLVIKEMAECIGQDIRCVRPEIECNKMTHDCRDCIKEYFTNKVEREGE